MSPPESRRVENRVAGADANPYLALAASLACGYLGMIQDLEPTDPVKGSAHRLAYTLPRSPVRRDQQVQRLQTSARDFRRTLHRRGHPCEAGRIRRLSARHQLLGAREPAAERVEKPHGGEHRTCVFTSSASSTERHVEQQFGIQADDHGRGHPCQDNHPARADERPHLFTVAGEPHQRDHRERQLQAEDHLAQDQQLRRAALAIQQPPP